VEETTLASRAVGETHLLLKQGRGEYRADFVFDFHVRIINRFFVRCKNFLPTGSITLCHVATLPTTSLFPRENTETRHLQRSETRVNVHINMEYARSSNNLRSQSTTPDRLTILNFAAAHHGCREPNRRQM